MSLSCEPPPLEEARGENAQERERSQRFSRGKTRCGPGLCTIGERCAHSSGATLGAAAPREVRSSKSTGSPLALLSLQRRPPRGADHRRKLRPHARGEGSCAAGARAQCAPQPRRAGLFTRLGDALRGRGGDLDQRVHDFAGLPWRTDHHGIQVHADHLAAGSSIILATATAASPKVSEASGGSPRTPARNGAIRRRDSARSTASRRTAAAAAVGRASPRRTCRRRRPAPPGRTPGRRGRRSSARAGLRIIPATITPSKGAPCLTHRPVDLAIERAHLLLACAGRA